MKLRKSKSDRSFRIDYSIQIPAVVKNKGNVGGWEVRMWTTERQPPVFVLGHNRASVLRGFLWGRDRNNITIDRCVCQCHL